MQQAPAWPPQPPPPAPPLQPAPSAAIEIGDPPQKRAVDQQVPLSTQAASSAAVAELVTDVAQTQITVPWSAAILEVSALSPLTPIAAPASGQGGAVAVSGEAIGRDDEAQMDTGVDQGAAGGVDLNATPDATVYP